MRHGVSNPAIAPPATAAPARGQCIRRTIRFSSQLLLALMITFALAPPLPTPAAAVAAATARAAFTHVQTYAAWTCSGVYHVVRRGETIYSIARRYGTTAYRIAVCNGLASYTVYVGQTLLVPTGR